MKGVMFMPKLKDFFNKISGNDRIYTREDIADMSSDEYVKAEDAINYQLNEAGIPTKSDLMLVGGVVYVEGYTRSDGTEVKGHYRSKRGSLKNTIDTVHKSANNLEKVASGIDINLLVDINNYLNRNNHDARDLANIFLKQPKTFKDEDDFAYIQKGFADSVNKAFELTGSGKIDDNWEGFVFNEHSPFAERLSASTQMQKQISENYNSAGGKFNSNKLSVNFTDDPNLHLSIGHATIINPKVDKDGYFSGILFDKYDFDHIKDGGYSLNKSANNFFYWLQENEFRKNYYILIPIKFKMR